MSYLKTWFDFKDVYVVDLVYFQYVYNRCRSKNYDISEKKETEDVPNIQPVANIWFWLPIQPLGILDTK